MELDLAGSAKDREIEDLYRRLYLTLMSRVRWKFGLSKEDASDIVQDAFAIALVKLDATSNPQAWLIQVVDFLASNMSRKLKRRSLLLARWIGDPRLAAGFRPKHSFAG
jgi:DNA-directed RNA polymerase specialized sigma24 family protein